MVRRALASLLIGAVLTTLVAWGGVVVPSGLSAMSGVALTADAVPAWLVHPREGRSMTLVITELVTDEGVLQKNLHVRRRPEHLWPPVPPWSRAARLDAAQVAAGNAPAAESAPVLVETAAGWPWPSLRAGFRYAPPPGPMTATVERGIRVPGLWESRGPEVHHAVLPTAPIWPGFLGSAAVYALAVFPVISARSWRRSFRARRGLCLRCAYPAAGLERCPECGALHGSGSSTAA